MNEPPRVTVAVDPHPVAASRGVVGGAYRLPADGGADPHPVAASRGVVARRHRDGFSQAVEYAFRPRHALFEHGELTFNAIHACVEFVDASAGRASIRFTPVRSRAPGQIIDVGSGRKSIARNRKALGGVASRAPPAYDYCMDATAYNPLATARRLREAGFDQKQAETIADEVRSAATAGGDTLATKADVELAIAGLEARLYRALWVQGVGIVAVVGGFIAIAAALDLFA